MTDLEQLRKAHGEAREAFERACMRDYITREDYEAIRARYHQTMDAYHTALGYGSVVSSPQDTKND